MQVPSLKFNMFYTVPKPRDSRVPTRAHSRGEWPTNQRRTHGVRLRQSLDGSLNMGYHTQYVKDLPSKDRTCLRVEMIIGLFVNTE